MPETVREAIVQVCRDAFHWKRQPRGIFLRAGVPKSIYERHDTQDNGKAMIARLVLDDLDELGDQRAALIEHRIVEELCRWKAPHRDAPDHEAGRAALAELKRTVEDDRILIDPARAEIQARRQKAEQDRADRERYQRKLKALLDHFSDLSRDRYRTPAELQQRGYELESLLADLFELNKISHRRPYRSPHEQHDGAFNFRGFTYILEAKWQKHTPTFDDMVKFKFKVDGKLESVRGLFVAMAGFDDNTLDHLFNVARGSRNNLILMDRVDLLEVLEGRMTLEAAITAKVDAAEQEGRWWLPLCR